MNNIPNFNFYCQKILPLVYENSLSYYETLCKITKVLNTVIDSQNELGKNFEEIVTFIQTQLEKFSKEQLKEWLDDGTLAVIINEVVFKELNDKIDVTKENLNDLKVVVDTNTQYNNEIFTNAKSLGLKCDGTDETLKLQAIIDSGENIVVPDGVAFTNLYITTNYQHITFRGRTTVLPGGWGISMGKVGAPPVSGVKLEVDELFGGSVQTQCGLHMVLAQFCEISINRIEYLLRGISFLETGDATENKLEIKIIQGCDLGGILICNIDGSKRHEGNQFNVSLFGCKVGMSIDSGSKFQQVVGVIDCATSPDSMDVIDMAGANQFLLYYVRGNKIDVSVNSLIYVFSNDSGNFIRLGKCNWLEGEIGNYEGFLINQGKFRSRGNANALDLIFLGGDLTQSDIQISVNSNGFPSLKSVSGSYGGNFGLFNISSLLTPREGNIVIVTDTFSNTTRVYIFANNLWRIINTEPEYITTETVLANSYVTVTHNKNVDGTLLYTSFCETGARDKLNTNLSISYPNSNQLLVWNDSDSVVTVKIRVSVRNIVK